MLAALANAAIAVVLALRLPSRTPSISAGYRTLLASMGRLLADEPVLRRHALSAALAMAAFSAFWTAVGLRLAQPPFGLDLHGIALFAFAGASGAIVTPLAGRAGDHGHGPAAQRIAHVTMLVALVFSASRAPAGSASTHTCIAASRSRCWPAAPRCSTRASSSTRRSAAARSTC